MDESFELNKKHFLGDEGLHKELQEILISRENIQRMIKESWDWFETVSGNLKISEDRLVYLKRFLESCEQNFPEQKEQIRKIKDDIILVEQEVKTQKFLKKQQDEFISEAQLALTKNGIALDELKNTQNKLKDFFTKFKPGQVN